MKIIDQTTWNRRSHFEFFNTFDIPQFSIVADVDATALLAFCKDRRLSVFLSTVYLLTKTANEIPELRTRIRADDLVVEHDLVHPGFTVLNEDELFNFCTTTFCRDSRLFFAEAGRQIEETRLKQDLIEDEPGRDDLLFMTCIPWVSFTALQHPISLGSNHSIPKIAWGKLTSSAGRSGFPVSLQAHHGLCDGLHAGRFFEQLQQAVDCPEAAIT